MALVIHLNRITTATIKMSNIVNEIRLMRRSYFRQYQEYPKIICLDGFAEARLVAYIVYQICDESISVFEDISIDEILEEGIRYLGLILCGMSLQFDCPTFCLHGNINPHFSIQFKYKPK